MASSSLQEVTSIRPIQTTRFCGQCENEIPVKRLAAKPNARLCIVCQETQDVMISEPAVDMNRLFQIPQERDHTTGSGVVKKYKKRGFLSTEGLGAVIRSEGSRSFARP